MDTLKNTREIVNKCRFNHEYKIHLHDIINFRLTEMCEQNPTFKQTFLDMKFDNYVDNMLDICKSYVKFTIDVKDDKNIHIQNQHFLYKYDVSIFDSIYIDYTELSFISFILSKQDLYILDNKIVNKMSNISDNYQSNRYIMRWDIWIDGIYDMKSFEFTVCSVCFQECNRCYCIGNKTYDFKCPSYPKKCEGIQYFNKISEYRKITSYGVTKENIILYKTDINSDRIILLLELRKLQEQIDNINMSSFTDDLSIMKSNHNNLSVLVDNNYDSIQNLCNQYEIKIDDLYKQNENLRSIIYNHLYKQKDTCGDICIYIYILIYVFVVIISVFMMNI